MEEVTAKHIYDLLISEVLNVPGKILFLLGSTSVKITTTDIVGNCLQSWLKQWLHNKNIFASEPLNTQEFPDFFLSADNTQDHMLEVKAFNCKATPAFDIANYESYVSSVAERPYRLDADYIIFGYTMDDQGIIKINKIWLKKIWEIAGVSKDYPLKTQVKRGVIYNIRPNSAFKKDKEGPFKSKEEFLLAMYDTQKKYRGQEAADRWKARLINNYQEYYGRNLIF